MHPIYLPIALRFNLNDFEVNPTREVITIREDYKDKIEYPIFSQPKLDGIRCIVTKDGMFSRNGKEILSAPHIRKQLDKVFKEWPYLVFDGELYADKFANDFNSIVSLVKKTKPTEDDLLESQKNIQYWIYDIPSSNKSHSGSAMQH